MLLSLKRYLSEHSDWALRTLVVLIGLIIVGVELGNKLMFFSALYIYSLGTIIYNGVKLFGFLKRIAIEKSYKAYADFFSIGSLLYFFVSTLIVVVACITVFSGMPNVYLLITSFFIVFAVIVYDLVKK